MKGFRPKAPGEISWPYDPRIEAGYWERFFREAKRRAKAWRGCQVCPESKRDPKAQLEVHHVITQQRLKRLAKERGYVKGGFRWLALLTDSRNSMVIDEHCHYGHTYRARPIHRGLIPDYAWEFIEENGLEDEALEEYPA